jgi:hypothetical protein
VSSITKGEDVREDKVARRPSACLGKEIKLSVQRDGDRLSLLRRQD